MKSQQESQDALYERSGKFSSNDRLTNFLHALMRDHLTPGKVEKIMQRERVESLEMIQYSNGWLAQYAADLSRRLRGSNTKLKIDELPPDQEPPEGSSKDH